MKKRMISVALAAGLLGIAPLAAAPAQATETLATTSTLEVRPSYNGPVYGSTVDISASIKDVNGSSVYDGEATLWVWTAANPNWTPVQTVPSGGYILFDDVKLTSKSQFKVTYGGYTADPANTYDDTYLYSESAPKGINTIRNVKLDNPKSTIVKIKVAPTYKNKPIVVQKKKGKRWVKFRTYRTNRFSKVTFKLPAPSRGKWYWKISVPGDKLFGTWTFVGHTYRY